MAGCFSQTAPRIDCVASATRQNAGGFAGVFLVDAMPVDAAAQAAAPIAAHDPRRSIATARGRPHCPSAAPAITPTARCRCVAARIQMRRTRIHSGSPAGRDLRVARRRGWGNVFGCAGSGRRSAPVHHRTTATKHARTLRVNHCGAGGQQRCRQSEYTELSSTHLFHLRGCSVGGLKSDPITSPSGDGPRS